MISEENCFFFFVDERASGSCKSSFLDGETIAGGIEKPRVIVGALHASEETKGLTGKLSGCERTRVREGTVRLSLLVAALFPILEVTEGRQLGWRLDPFDYLGRWEQTNFQIIFFRNI